MQVQKYRYYCLDQAGELHNVEWFEAANDKKAVAFVKARHPNDICEIWQGSRLVAKLDPAPVLARTRHANPPRAAFLPDGPQCAGRSGR